MSAGVEGRDSLCAERDGWWSVCAMAGMGDSVSLHMEGEVESS